MATKCGLCSKLIWAFTAVLMVALALGVETFYATSSIGGELDEAVNRTSKKLDLVQAMGKRVQ